MKRIALVMLALALVGNVLAAQDLERLFRAAVNTETVDRNCKAAIIYEGTRDIHTLMQADWALGLKKEKPARRTLPPWKK